MRSRRPPVGLAALVCKWRRWESNPSQLVCKTISPPLVHAPPQTVFRKGPPGARTRSSSLPKRRAAATPADQPCGTSGVGGRQSARAPGLSLPPTTDTPPDSSRGGNRTHNRLTRLSTWPLYRFAYSAFDQSRAQVTLLACGGYEPPPGTGPPGLSVTRVGVEPTTHQGLSLAALPVCVPRRPYSGPGGSRTHSIRGSEPRWSADCLPSHVFSVPGEGVEPPGTRV
jgi:hypothetical protein